MRVIVLIVAILATPFQTTFGHQADPRREPAKALKEAVRLLESKNYEEFLQKCISPAELETGIKKLGSLKDIVVEFNRTGRFELALKALQAALKTQPTFNGEGTRANYRFDAPIGGETRLQLTKINGLWYWTD
jgi:hypothetical protein